MPISILQEFLNQQFITPDQEDNISSLEKAAADFEKKLRSRKVRIPQAVLLAFDPQAPAGEAMFLEVQDLVVNKWRNFASKCQGQPVTYLRAVMLSALQGLAADPKFAGIIWLTAVNYFPYTARTHREGDVLLRFLTDIRTVFEQASLKNWELGQFSKLPALPDIKTSGPKQVATVKADYAQEQMKASVSAIDSKTSNNKIFHSLSGHNIYNPQVTASPDWAQSFGSISGNAMTELVNGAIKNINEVLKDTASVSQLAEYINEITQYFKAVTDRLANQTVSHNLRSNLLWIKETQYSVSQQKSFRSLTDSARPVILAYDTAQQVPEIYPASVEFFIRETLAVSDQLAEQEHTFEPLLTDLAATRDNWQPTLDTVLQAEPGRQPLLSFIASVGRGSTTYQQLESMTGLSLSATLSRADFAVWLFREMEVQKLVAAK